MMSSDDDDVEPQLKVVESYYFVDDSDEPVSFHALPFQFDAAERVPSFSKDVYLRGFTDGGLQNVYKQVVAWKLGLDGLSPEITVLSTEGSWIVLLKPRPSYEETVRTVLITVEMLHFVRRRPTDSESDVWDHLRRVFAKFAVRPSEDDFKNHQPLIKMFADRDPALANVQILEAFVKDWGTEKIDEIGSNKREVEQTSIAGDEKRDEMVDDERKFESNNDNEEDEEEEEELFDTVCAICDNGGDLLCCEGQCMRSFHAKLEDGEDSYCATLGYTKAEVKAIQNFVCKNCEHKKHQCFVCGELEPSDENAKVFLCNNATCGHFYHPKCVAPLLHPNNRNEASEMEKKIVSGFSFTCPVHWCFCCKGLEDRTQEPLQFAVCRRCPKSYHRKCLPSKISFEESDGKGIITRAWELSKRILIYCFDHDMDLDLGTPSRDHMKFPSVESSTDCVKKKVKKLVEKKKRTFDDFYVDDPLQKGAKLQEKFNAKDNVKARRSGMKSSIEQNVFEPKRKKTKYVKEKSQPEASSVSAASGPKQPQKQEPGTMSSQAMGETPWSSFPIVDSEIEKRVITLVETEVSSLTLEDISRRFFIPSTYASAGRQIDKIIARGKLERSVQGVQAALQKLEDGGTLDDAKAVCEPEVLRQLIRWNNKFRVYLAPFIHGMRYTSLGRHFTKKDKLSEIVEKLHWYVQPGDTIVDFSCGLNDFSQFMKEKLDKVGKRCNFKNYDVIQPKNSFCFEKRDWMTVRQRELPHGSKLIMGLNPPFGVKAMLANKFIEKALTFKPKLIILIVPKEAERLDWKRPPYDLVWEDNESLSGKSFYLPGSLDVSDKQMDQWNVYPPPLYLWSHPDWTEKHKKIAEKYGHTENMSSNVRELDYLNDIPSQIHAEFSYEQDSTSRKERGVHMDEIMNFVGEKLEQVDGFPPEKRVEVAYEETKVVSNKSNSYRADYSGVRHEERYGNSELNIACHSYGRRAIETSDLSREIINESEKTAGHDVEGDSDMSISPTDSRIPFPPMPSEAGYPSEKMAHADNYFNHPVPEPCTSHIGSMPYEDSYFRQVDEYGIVSVENCLSFSTQNMSPGLEEEQTGLYAGDPTGNLYSSVSGGTGGSFYNTQNFEDRSVVYTMTSPGSAKLYDGRITDDNPQTAMNPPPATDIRAQIRMYGGHVRDDHSQVALNSPDTDDIRAQIRMYGGLGTYDHPHTGPHYSQSSDAGFEGSALYGTPSLGSSGRSAMDNYAPRLRETSYTRSPYGVPDDVNYAIRHRHPYSRPGSSGGRHG